MSTAKVTSFLREIAIIVIGVLLALFINNWNESNKQQKLINKTLYAISQEIRQNQQELDEILELHYTTIDTLEANLSDDQRTLEDIFVALDGFQIPEIKNIGLRFFISSNAELIDYNIISDLSEIEFLTEAYNLKLDNMIQFFYRDIQSNSSASKRQTYIILTDIIESEESLLNLFDDFLKNHAAIFTE